MGSKLVHAHWDTIVVGGGLSGVSTAVSAAREGNKVLVVDKLASLGGSPVHALVSPMMDSRIAHGRNLVELEERLKRHGLTTREDKDRMGYVWFSPEVLAVVLEEMLFDAGGELLLEATLCGVHIEDDKIIGLDVMTCEGFLLLTADQFVDATGDALLSRLAGVPCEAGDDNGNNQVCSLRFGMAGIDVAAYRNYCLSLGDTFSPLVDGYFWESAMVAGKGFALEPLFTEGVDEGLLDPSDLVYYQCFSIPGAPSAMAFNCPHLPSVPVCTTAASRTTALVEGRRRVQRLVRFLQQKMPGFEHAFLTQTASMLGVRESWRIRGSYVLDVEDYMQRARFADAVSRGTWYIDVHSATKGLVHMEKYQPGEYYEIPYRCLTNSVVKNVITVGRCISTSFLVQASIRIQQTITDMGDTAGRACARAHAQGVELAEFDGTGLIDW